MDGKLGGIEQKLDVKFDGLTNKLDEKFDRLNLNYDKFSNKMDVLIEETKGVKTEVKKLRK